MNHVHTQYDSRLVGSIVRAKSDVHTIELGCLDAPAEVVTGSHRGLDSMKGERYVYAWSVDRPSV